MWPKSMLWLDSHVICTGCLPDDSQCMPSYYHQQTVYATCVSSTDPVCHHLTCSVVLAVRDGNGHVMVTRITGLINSVITTAGEGVEPLSEDQVLALIGGWPAGVAGGKVSTTWECTHAYMAPDLCMDPGIALCWGSITRPPNCHSLTCDYRSAPVHP